MSRLKGLLRALHQRARSHAKIGSLRASTKALRLELRSAREALSDAAAQIGALQMQLDQLIELRRNDTGAAARMDRLERILDVERVANHIRDALTRAEFVDDPVPHGIVSGLLPPDVYDAVLDAIPARLFFERGDAAGAELRVPPRLGPTHAIATWTFVSDIVSNVLVPALIGCLRERVVHHRAMMRPAAGMSPEADVRFTVDSDRLVLRQPGGYVPADRAKRSHVLTTVVHLARPGDGEDYGSRLRREIPGGDATPDVGSPEANTTRQLPFRANSVLIVVGPPGAHEYVPIPSSAPEGTLRYTYEFRVGAQVKMRRAP